MYFPHRRWSGKAKLHCSKKKLWKTKFILAFRKQHNLKDKNVVLPGAVDSF